MVVDCYKLPFLNSGPVRRLRSLNVIPLISFPIDYRDRQEFFWPPSEKYHVSEENMIVGSEFDFLGGHIFKSIHVSRDNKFVFEVVFSYQGDLIPENACWFVRIISENNVSNLISVKGINILHQKNDRLNAIGNLIEPIWSVSRFTDVPITAVPYVHRNPIEGNESFYSYLENLVADAYETPKYRNHHLLLDPIKYHEPSILNGIIDGRLFTNPLNQIIEFHPGVNRHRYTHSLWEQIRHTAQVKRAHLVTNHEILDNIVNEVIAIPFNFSIAMSFHSIIDRTYDVNIIYEFEDSYGFLNTNYQNRKIFYEQKINDLFDKFLETYYYYIMNTGEPADSLLSQIWNRSVDDKSYIKITKRNTEEIGVEVYDAARNETYCFYSFIPAIIMTTLAIGRYRLE